MEIGQLKTVNKVDNTLVCDVDFGAGHVERANYFCLAGASEYPLPGDEVICIRDEDFDDGDEYTIVAVYQPMPGGVAPGERLLYGRDAVSGSIRSKLHFGAKGNLTLNDGVEPAVKGNSFMQLHNAHVHPTAFGPSGVPATPMSNAQLNSTVLL